MKKTICTILLALSLAAAGFAQTATVNTTLAVALTDNTTNSIQLTSATHVSAGGFLYVDREVMAVLSSYVSGTIVPVARGNSGTKASKHAALAVVWVFAPGNEARAGLRSGQEPGSDPSGSCTATAEPLLPVFNTTFGTVFNCIASQWVRTGAPGSVLFCGATSGATATCSSATGQAARVIAGSATLASNASVITFSPGFTGTATYSCTANDVTTRANVVQAVPTSATTMTITNTTGASDVVQWICAGY